MDTSESTGRKTGKTYLCAVCIEIKNALSDIISTPLCTLLALPASLSQNAWCALSLTPNPISNYAFSVLQGRRSRGYLGGHAPPDFDRSVNPISTGGSRLSPRYYNLPPQIFRPFAIPADVFWFFNLPRIQRGTLIKCLISMLSNLAKALYREENLKINM